MKGPVNEAEKNVIEDVITRWELLDWYVLGSPEMSPVNKLEVAIRAGRYHAKLEYEFLLHIKFFLFLASQSWGW